MRFLALVVTVLQVASGVAQAKSPGKKAAAEAKRHYDAGIAAYRAGNYEEAIHELETGYAIKPEPQQLYNLGQACRQAKQLESAIDYFKRFLDEVPDAENRPLVEQRIAELQREVDARNAPPPPATPEPAPAAAVTPAPEPKPPGAAQSGRGPKTPYQLGARIRGIFVTSAMLTPYLDAKTEMNSVAVGVEFIYRRRTFDVVTSLDFSWLDVQDGNYLGAGHPPDTDTKFTEFKGLSFLSADVSIIGHVPITRWLEFRGGAGLGVGVVFGDVLVTTNAGCNAGNVNDISQCHPLGVDLNSPNREDMLKATEDPNQKDTAGSPHRHSASEKPPAMGVVNIVAGFRFIVHPRVTIQVEGGFRNAAFVGVGSHFLF